MLLITLYEDKKGIAVGISFLPSFLFTRRWVMLYSWMWEFNRSIYLGSFFSLFCKQEFWKSTFFLLYSQKFKICVNVWNNTAWIICLWDLVVGKLFLLLTHNRIIIKTLAVISWFEMHVPYYFLAIRYSSNKDEKKQ